MATNSAKVTIHMVASLDGFIAKKDGTVSWMHSNDLEVLIHDQLQAKYKNIWLVGGAMLTKAFLRLKLADEIVISIMPIILGDGTLFFDYIGKEQRLHLKDVTAYKDGMVELSYEIKRDVPEK